MTTYAVVCRMIGDDEDTVHIVDAASPTEAKADAIEWLWSLENCTEQQRAQLEAAGIGVVINHVLQSNTTIHHIECNV